MSQTPVEIPSMAALAAIRDGVTVPLGDCLADPAVYTPARVYLVRYGSLCVLELSGTVLQAQSGSLKLYNLPNAAPGASLGTAAMGGQKVLIESTGLYLSQPPVGQVRVLASWRTWGALP